MAGSEVNIGTDGSLDYPDELLGALDWVIASVHTSFSDDSEEMTARLLAAIENPLVDCIGHLTGRLLLRRPPYPVDIEAVADAAARTGTMLEINGNPNRRDLSEHHARLAAEAGATIVLNTDAHGVDTLENIAYAVATARRAWLSAEQIANTRGWREFKALRKRGGRRREERVPRRLTSARRWWRRGRVAGGCPVPAEAGRPDKRNRAKGGGRLDVEAGSVALLHPEHRRLSGPPGERDQQGVAGADRGDSGEEETETAGDQGGDADRPEPGERDPRRRFGRQGGRRARRGQRIADAVGGALGAGRGIARPPPRSPTRQRPR